MSERIYFKDGRPLFEYDELCARSRQYAMEIADAEGIDPYELRDSDHLYFEDGSYACEKGYKAGMTVI